MIKKLILLIAIWLVALQPVSGQARDDAEGIGSLGIEEQELIADLQALDAQSAQIPSPLARARAKAEIADSLWHFDKQSAKRILTEAFELTFPTEEEQKKLRSKPIGEYTFQTEDQRARNEIRRRVLQVARRDSTYASSLIETAGEHLGRNALHRDSAELAMHFMAEGDRQEAGKFIAEAVNADPTETTAALLIADLARKDRALADKLTLQYIEQLRTLPFINFQTLGRTYFVLAQLIFPVPARPGERPLSPGPQVMKAYARYVIESFKRVKAVSPGSLPRLRVVLTTAWQPVRQYAPELIPDFLELERASRATADDSMPTFEEMAASAKRNREKQISNSIENEVPDAAVIEAVADRGDFEKARKILDKVKDRAQRARLAEYIDAREAVYLSGRGDSLRARQLAQKLQTAAIIFDVYSVLIKKCNKDLQCAIPLGYQALHQLKQSDSDPPTAPAYVPQAAWPTERESDHKLLSLSKLAKVSIPLEEELSQAVISEMIRAANSTKVDSAQGRLGFEADVFKLIASRNETSAQQAARSLNDPLRQVIALAVIGQWKANELVKKKQQQSSSANCSACP